MSPDTPIRALTHLSALPDESEAVTAAMASLAGPSRADPGCRGWQLFASGKNPRDLIVISDWDSMAAFEAHLGKAYFKNALADIAGRLDGEPDTRFYCVIA